MRHYDDTKIINWLRIKVFKVEKPYSLPWGQWKIWRADFRATRPVAYFFTESMPAAIEWVHAHTIEYVSNFRYYVHNRASNSHRLDSTLEKGKYHEFSNRMLYSLFDSYVDFIEIEEAYNHLAWATEKDRKKYNVPFWDRYWFFRWGKGWRCEAAAIDHLKWEMTLDTPNPKDPNWQSSPLQAKSAREKMELYVWWKKIRPMRGDAWEVSGLKTFWDEMEKKYGDGFLGIGGRKSMSPAESRKYDKLSNDQSALEQAWDDEDDAMIHRLVDIRKSLWT